MASVFQARRFPCLLSFALALTVGAPCISTGQGSVHPAARLPISITKPLRGDDVVASISGSNITRKDLTRYWIATDPRAAAALGAVLADHIRSAPATASSYVVPDTEIYSRLYSDHNLMPSEALTILVDEKLVAQEAERNGIVVTRLQAQQSMHEWMDRYRAQSNPTITDDQILKGLGIPRDIELERFLCKLRAERLLEADFSKRLGHSLGPDDYAGLYALVSPAVVYNNVTRDQSFERARERLDSWLEEIQHGSSLEDVVRSHPEVMSTSGEWGPVLRGAGVKTLEDQVFSLKLGERSQPLRIQQGWAVFRMDKRGAQIPDADRQRRWQFAVQQFMPDFVKRLREAAHVSSTIPLARGLSDASALDPVAGDAFTPPAPPGR